jgi:pimeloyl-ACP methyl ester carboxylesterase
MLARLLRFIYLFQLICAALVGSYLAIQSAAQGAGAIALAWVPVAMLGVPVLIQFAVIFTSMWRSHTGSEWGLWWSAFWGEFKTALRVFGLRQPWPYPINDVRLPAKGNAGPAAIPVLLVHGYICNHRVWDDMARALLESGHPVLAMDLEPLFTSIDDYAAMIERAVDTLLYQTGSTKLALVGHSMGGLAIRAWLRANNATRQAQVSRIITLGTPHQGTQIANASATTNGAQMLWHSPWLAELASSETSVQRALMHIVLTRQDHVVYPQREQVLDGAQVTEFEGLGHLELCLDRRVIDWVTQQVAVASTDTTA